MLQTLESLSDDLQLPIANFMYASAKKHADHSGGLLVAIEPDTETHPHQSLLHPVVRSHGELSETVNLTPIASAIRPQYPQVLSAISSVDKYLPEDEQALTLVAEVLKSKQNVVFGYDHGEDVITFAINSTASTNVLRDKGLDFRSAIVASKMLDFLAIDLNNFGDHTPAVEAMLNRAGVEIQPTKLVHARHVLSRVFNIQYLTIPNTQTTEEFRKRNKIAIKTYNHYVRSKIVEDMEPPRFNRRKQPLLVHVATPGSLNYPMDVAKFHQLKRRNIFDFESSHNPETFKENQVEVIGGASDAILTIFARALTYAVTAKMRDKPFFAIDSAHLTLDSAEAVRELGRKQAALLDKAEPEIVHVYDVARNLPLIRR